MNSPAPPILILTGSFGHGHNTAARNLETAFHQALGNPAGVEVADFFASAYPRTNALLRRGYGFAINSTPSLWKQLYRMADHQGPLLMPQRIMARRLAAFLHARRPRAVVATFPGYPVLLEHCGKGPSSSPACPLFTVVTDAISINSVWCRGRPEMVFVTDTWSREVVHTEGIPLERIRAHGFPLKPTDQTDEPPSLPGHPPRILYLATTKTAHVRRTLQSLVPWCRRHHAHLTVVLGSHENRLRPLTESLLHSGIAPDQQRILGWCSDVPALMRRSHLTITKAGGATVSETLGAHCPVLLNYVVPGQEEGNALLIERSQCGRRLRRGENLSLVLDEILVKDDAAPWHRFRSNLRLLDRARASSRIVDDVLTHIDHASRGSGVALH